MALARGSHAMGAKTGQEFVKAEVGKLSDLSAHSRHALEPPSETCLGLRRITLVMILGWTGSVNLV